MIKSGLRKELLGVVLSDKMQKTIVVESSRRITHKIYQKTITRRARFYAHDEKEQAGIGDLVRIRESRPLSKNKRWALVEVVRKGDEGMVHSRTRGRKQDKSSAAKGEGK
jgi:small subunit ribosomal protein S17